MLYFNHKPDKKLSGKLLITGQPIKCSFAFSKNLLNNQSLRRNTSVDVFNA